MPPKRSRCLQAALLACVLMLSSLPAIAEGQNSASTSTRSGTPAPYAEVIALPSKKRAPPPIADEAYWFSLGIGAAHISSYNALAYNLGFYGSADRFVYGLRVSGNRGDWSAENGHDVRYGREQALIVGRYLDARNMTWAGIGVSRVDGVGGRHPDQRNVGVGLPMEFVFSPPGRYVAPEVRFNIDLNKMNSVMMLSIGARFGQLK